jgi:hypothetical protein
MSTLNAPPIPLSPRDDAMQLHRAFKGRYFGIPFSLSPLFDFFFDIVVNNNINAMPICLLNSFCLTVFHLIPCKDGSQQQHNY